MLHLAGKASTRRRPVNSALGRTTRMAQHSSLPEGRDGQFEWFRTVVQQLRTTGVGAVTVALRQDMGRFAESNLPGHAFPHLESDEEFVEQVLKLKDNDLVWNKALQTTLLRSYDFEAPTARENSVRELNEFAATCPWALYAEIARFRAEHLTGPGELE